MKVDVVTLHNVRNHGSLLQTYALQHVLEEQGHTCEIIDFIPIGLTLKKGIATIRKSGNPVADLIRKTGAAAAFSIQQRMVRRFLRENIRLTPKTYHTFAELEAQPPAADVYISGSDQIWNTQNANAPDDVKGYYLAFLHGDEKRLSYASSIGKDAFDAAEAEMVAGFLRDYRAISVREKQAVELLDSIGLHGAVHVVDPTLLLDAESWKGFCKVKKKTRPYIFVYNLNRNPEIKKAALALAEKERLDIVNFADTLDYLRGAKNAFGNSPHEFLFYLANASYVLTDSFHGTAFSINFGKQFLTFPAPRFNSRIESILSVFALTDRFCTEPERTIEQVCAPINRTQTEAILAEERSRCRQWLAEAIEH